MSGITLTQMQHILTTEAERIGIVQQELIAAGIRTVADPGQMQQKAVFEAAVRLIEILASDTAMLARLKERTRDAKRAAAEVTS